MIMKYMTILLMIISLAPGLSFAEEEGNFFEVVPQDKRESLQKGNNCGSKKGDLNGQFAKCVFGSCSHITAIDADATAYGALTPQLAVECPECILNVQVGHKTVKNSNWCCRWNTYLSYACGDRP